MHILFLSQLVPYPPDAGPKVRSYNVLQHLARAGHSVTLVAFERSSDRPEYLDHLRQFCTAIHTVPMVRSKLKDVWHLGRSLLNGEPFLIARDDVGEMYRLIEKLMGEQPFDAVHVDQLWMAQYALHGRSHLNGHRPLPRLVLDQHNAVYLIPQRLAASSANPIKQLVLNREARAMKQYELETYRQFDRVVWVTNEDRLALLPAGTEQPTDQTIPICVDTSHKKAIPPSPQARRVTFLGGLHWPPNADGVVWFAQEVWPRVVAEVPDACLTIIGKDPPQALRSFNPPLPNLDVTGYVDDVEPYLADTAAFIVPLHAGGGMRVKIVDAWSWGLPIVSTTIGAEGTCFEHGRNLLLGDTAEDFAAAVVLLLNNPELRTSLSTAGRETAETKYDWRTIYTAWNTIYG